MIEKLFISKVRCKILDIFLTQDNAQYHVRALVRLLEEEINAIRRELKNLSDVEILVSEARGNRVVYSVNESCPIINELRSLMYKSKEKSKTLIDIVNRNGKTDLLFVSKQYFADQGGEDVDIVAVGDFDVNALSKELTAYEKVSERQYKVAVYTNQDFQYNKKKRDSFLLNALSSDKILLIGNYFDLYN